jgi:hypothetical protein
MRKTSAEPMYHAPVVGQVSFQNFYDKDFNSCVEKFGNGYPGPVNRQ